jgi:hypothetical protein
MEEANDKKALTIAISNNPNGKILKLVWLKLYLIQKKKLSLAQLD